MIAILGGGVAGASLARALACRGSRDVVLCDPRTPGQGSSGRALGGFRTQHGSELNIRLSLHSRPYFEARSDRIRFEPNGYLYLAENPDVAAKLRRRAEFQAGAGLPIEHPEPGALVPFLKTSDLHGTNFCALDGVYQPSLVLACLIEEARAAGAELRYGTEVRAADLRAETIVIAAGIWSAGVARELGVELAVEPLERVVYQIGPLDWLPPRLPLTLEAGSGYHFRERDGRLLVMGPGDQHEWSHYRDWLAWRVPAAAVERPEAHWSGFYEMTADHHPLLGQTERSGVWAACGFSGHGVMHAPAASDSLAAMILGDSPPLDIRALSPMRTEPLVDLTQL